MADLTESSKSLPVAGYLAVELPAIQIGVPTDFAHQLREINIVADPRNTDIIWLGNKDTQGIPLEPGDDYTIPIGDPGAVYVRAESGTQHIGYLGRD